MSTELATPTDTSAFVSPYAADTSLATFAASGDFHPILKLMGYTSGPVKLDKAKPKDYVLRVSKDEIKVLGPTIQIKPLAYRFTALDFRETGKVKRYHNPNEADFKVVKAHSELKMENNPCTAGAEFLFAINGYGLATALCGNWSWKSIVSTLEALHKAGKFGTMGAKVVPSKNAYIAPTVTLYEGAFDIGDVYESARKFACAESKVEADPEGATDRDR